MKDPREATLDVLEAWETMAQAAYWLRDHAEEVELRYRGRWIAIDGDGVIASAADWCTLSAELAFGTPSIHELLCVRIGLGTMN